MQRDVPGLVCLVLFAAALLVSRLTQGTGIVRSDHARNIYIPDELTPSC